MRMTQRLLAGAQERGWRVNTPENPAERAGTVSIDLPARRHRQAGNCWPAKF